ncbi:hypothetical protein ACBJ59_11015 [Nonomuraea sp. MTCD27]|uniref:hypothetical protein n=1 Tax=Nonomuraea sp. MTCD27 TaxID=1676747 RepID=UPI0035BF34D6
MTATVKREYRRLADGLPWHGLLAHDNFNLVTARIRALIGDGQRFTWVATHEMSGLRPEVRTSQTAKKIHTSSEPLDDGTPYVHLWVHDSYGVWGISTTTADQAAARNDDTRRQVVLHFERTRSGEQLRIDQHAPCGDQICWVIALEGGGQ